MKISGKILYGPFGPSSQDADRSITKDPRAEELALFLVKWFEIFT